MGILFTVVEYLHVIGHRHGRQSGGGGEDTPHISIDGDITSPPPHTHTRHFVTEKCFG